MTMKNNSCAVKATQIILAGALSLTSWSVLASDEAADTSSNFQISGFLSIVGGSTSNGSLGPNYSGPTQLNGINCPCYTADWSNAGIYGSNFSVKPESRAGIQVQYNFSPKLNFVGQAVIRGEDTNPNIQWAYFNYKLDEHWEVHAGRQRIPLYYYSAFQDVGFAYPWVGVPPELYGWEATNYDGASLRYTNSFGDKNLTASVFGGQEKLGHSLYYKLNYDGDTDVSWKHIVGADAEVNDGPLTVRLVYLQTAANDINNLNQVNDEANLKAYGVAANLDFDSWFVLSELTQLTRDFTAATQYKITVPAYTIGAGLRLGKWTPFINYADYKEHSSNLADYIPTTYKRVSLTAKYDIDSNSDFKAQIDRNWDVTATWAGNVNVIRVSYDRVF